MEREVDEQEPESDRQRSTPVVELEWEQQRDEPGLPPKGNEEGLTDAGEPVDQRAASDEPDEPLATLGLLRADRTEDDGHRAQWTPRGQRRPCGPSGAAECTPRRGRSALLAGKAP
jgi:hypothetical protein